MQLIIGCLINTQKYPPLYRRVFVKKIVYAVAASLAIASSVAFSHHMAEDIVDSDVYDLIDDLVADTPHADMTIEIPDSGTVTLTISTMTVTETENLIDKGLLDYASMLSGDANLNIDFNLDGSTTTIITQVLE